MDVFDLLKGVVKGMVGAISAHLFRKTFLDKEKTTRRLESASVDVVIDVTLYKSQINICFKSF